jgi:hypothetical protein
MPNPFCGRPYELADKSLALGPESTNFVFNESLGVVCGPVGIGRCADLITCIGVGESVNGMDSLEIHLCHSALIITMLRNGQSTMSFGQLLRGIPLIQLFDPLGNN